MTTFVAHRKVDMTVLPEIAAIAGADLDFQNVAPNTLVGSIDNVTYVMTGDFETGLIDSVSVITDGIFDYQFTGMNLPGENNIQSLDDVLAALFPGDDEVIGSNKGDHLIALGGEDRIYGRGGNDLISGGEGHDHLQGGGGRNSFLFDTSPASGDSDRIKDFRHGRDTIALDGDAFAGLGAEGALGADKFEIGKSANDSATRIIYDAKSGNLFYDADGAGEVDQLKIAVLSHAPDLSRHDLLIV